MKNVGKPQGQSRLSNVLPGECSLTLRFPHAQKKQPYGLLSRSRKTRRKASVAVPRQTAEHERYSGCNGDCAHRSIGRVITHAFENVARLGLNLTGGSTHLACDLLIGVTGQGTCCILDSACLTQASTLSLKEALPKVREEAHKALALDPRDAHALVALANADLAEGKHAEAKAYYERALALDPGNAVAHLDFGNLLPRKQDLAQTLEAVQLDPDSAGAQNSLAAAELDSGEYGEALIPAQAVMRLDPTNADSAMGLARIYSLLRRDADAVKAFDLAQPGTELAKALIAAGRLTYQSLLDPKLHARALAAVDALRRRADLDPDSMGDVMQLELALGQNAAALEQLPKLCANLWFACNDISVFPLWIPLRGDPRFEALVKHYDTGSQPAPAASAAPVSDASSP